MSFHAVSWDLSIFFHKVLVLYFFYQCGLKGRIFLEFILHRGKIIYTKQMRLGKLNLVGINIYKFIDLFYCHKTNFFAVDFFSQRINNYEILIWLLLFLYNQFQKMSNFCLCILMLGSRPNYSK